MALPLVLVAIALGLLAACSSGGGRGSRWTPPERYTQAPSACRADLQRVGARFTFWDPAASRPQCAVNGGIEVRELNGTEMAPVGMSCGLALAVADWLEDVDDAARDHLGSGLQSVGHFGAWSCRRMRGGSRWSLHATARAFDVAGFRLEDGRPVSVLKDWEDGAKGDFLHDAARAACARFGVVLTPDSNAAHEDHLHIDLGPWRSCGVDEGGWFSVANPLAVLPRIGFSIGFGL